MKKDALSVTMLIVVLTSLLAINTASSPPSTVIETQPRWKTALVGSTFNININVTDVLDLYGWEINMTFDKVVLNVVTVVEGPFLSDFASLVGVNTFFLGPTINNASGWVDVGCSLFPNPDPPDGADGSGVLATVTFKVMKYGRSDLHFTLSKLNSYDPGTGLPVPISHTAKDGIFDNRIPGDIAGPENPPSSGKFPYDAKVDTYDLYYLGKKFGSHDPVADFTGPENPPGSGTYPPDGNVNTYDLSALGKNFGKHYP